MTKTLTVATEIQKVVLTEVLFAEMVSGFWKNARPADHFDSWRDVSVVVGTELGVVGFDRPRDYNFTNPDYFQRAEEKLMIVAKNVNPNITVKQLKNQLIMLNRIIGGRLKSVNGPVAKLSRGRKTVTGVAGVVKSTTTAKSVVRKVAANIVDENTTSNVKAIAA